MIGLIEPKRYLHLSETLGASGESSALVKAGIDEFFLVATTVRRCAMFLYQSQIHCHGCRKMNTLTDQPTCVAAVISCVPRCQSARAALAVRNLNQFAELAFGGAETTNSH